MSDRVVQPIFNGDRSVRVATDTFANIARVEALRWRLTQRAKARWDMIQRALAIASAEGVTTADRPETEKWAAVRYRWRQTKTVAPGQWILNIGSVTGSMQNVEWGRRIGAMARYQSDVQARCSLVGFILEAAIRKRIGVVNRLGVNWRIVINDRAYWYASVYASERHVFGPFEEIGEERVTLRRVSWPDDNEEVRDLGTWERIG